MAGHTFIGKNRLCYTEVADFTDFQGIGRDPLYKRYDSVLSVIHSAIAPEYQHFLAAPQYVADEDRIAWHIDKWVTFPQRLVDLNGAERARYAAIKEKTIQHYDSAVVSLSGDNMMLLAAAIKYVDDERIYCADGKVYLVAWGMDFDTKAHKTVGSVIHDYDLPRRHLVSFDTGEHGRFPNALQGELYCNHGQVLQPGDIPMPIVEDGWELSGWSPQPVGYKVEAPVTFVAQYATPTVPVLPTPLPEEPLMYTCQFLPGEHGNLESTPSFTREVNSQIGIADIPKVKAHRGYRFTGWDTKPDGAILNTNRTFTAQYERVLPWYKRFWLWLAGLFSLRGCLSVLLSLLLGLLLLWLLSWLLRGCVGCSGFHLPTNGVLPVSGITRDDGTVVDDNGHVTIIPIEDGRLPDGNGIVAPVMGEGGADAPVVSQPGMPDIFGDRLILFLENEEGDLDALARDFKNKYPGNQYGIIGYDREVKYLVIQVPESERDEIRKALPSQLSAHKFIVFDEEIYEIHGDASSSVERAGWHLDAIHLRQGWAITKGSRDVKVAVVDDGIQASHPMFKGRIVDAYNVFTQDNSLSVGEGHGTHTAALAAGSTDFLGKGAAGVAPECSLMPIQVFDNGRCPLSALVAGVMYSLHHDADVVNISVGPTFPGLNALPVSEQEVIARDQFRNLANLWARVCAIAAKKKCILVFAAGNDDILTSIPPENRNQSSIVVTSVDARRYPTNFTNYGPQSDVSAPGKGILSAFPTDALESCDGTSMSAPIVTGTVALMKSLRRDITVEQVRNVLYSTGEDVYGWIPPMVLVDKALQATKKGDFRRVERERHSVPEDVDVHLHSGVVPQLPPASVDGGETVIIGGGTTPVTDGGTVVPTNPTTPPRQGRAGETDYDAIRRQIEEYKQRIRELEQMLR